MNRKDSYGIAGVNNYFLTFYSIGKPDRALLDPSPPATEDLHLSLVLDRIPLAY